MTAFEVHVNGERLCVAAIDGLGSVNVMADVIYRPVHDPTTGEAILGKLHPWLSLRVGGATLDGANVPTICTWAQRRLVVGDEIQIRVVDAKTGDEPTSREPSSVDDEKDNRRRWYEELKREFGD